MGRHTKHQEGDVWLDNISGLPVGTSESFRAGPVTGQGSSPSLVEKKAGRTMQQVCEIPEDADAREKAKHPRAPV